MSTQLLEAVSHGTQTIFYRGIPGGPFLGFHVNLESVCIERNVLPQKAPMDEHTKPISIRFAFRLPACDAELPLETGICSPHYMSLTLKKESRTNFHRLILTTTTVLRFFEHAPSKKICGCCPYFSIPRPHPTSTPRRPPLTARAKSARAERQQLRKELRVLDVLHRPNLTQLLSALVTHL